MTLCDIHCRYSSWRKLYGRFERLSDETDCEDALYNCYRELKAALSVIFEVEQLSRKQKKDIREELSDIYEWCLEQIEGRKLAPLRKAEYNAKRKN